MASFNVVYTMDEVGYFDVVEAKDEVAARKLIEDKLQKAYPESNVTFGEVVKAEKSEKKKKES